jgi:hypothetical protein
MDQPVASLHYSHRPKPYSNELELELTERAVIAERGRSKQTYPLDKMERIQLDFDPRNTAKLVFRCQIRVRDGNSVTFDSLSWKSLIQTERQDESYTAFVKALVTRAAKASPGMALVAGISPLRYRLMQAVGGILIAAMIAAALYFTLFPHPLAGSVNYLYAVLSMVFAFFAGSWLRDFLMRNHPRHFTADAIPVSVLPPRKAA